MAFKMIKEWWRTWREVAGHWQNLQPFFKPIVVRSFISWFALAPIVIKLMRELPERILINAGDHIYTLTLALPFNWIILWVASLFFFLSYVIYISTCPRFIKQFPNFAEFVRQNHSPRFLVWELARVWRSTSDKTKIATRLIDKKIALPVPAPVPQDNPRVEERGTIFVFEHSGKLLEVQASENDDEKKQRELFWEIFGPPARHAPVRRNLTWALLSLVVLLVGYVVCQQIWFVISFLIH